MPDQRDDSGETRRIGRRSRTTACLVIGSAALLVPWSVTAQECEVDDSDDHASWHTRQLALQKFEDELKALLIEGGASPFGGISIGRDSNGDLTVESRGLAVPPGLEDRFGAAMEELVATAGPEPGEGLSLDLGQPRPELWTDRTERCEAELDNVGEVGGLVAQVVAGALAQENKSRPDRIRISLWTRVDWTGRVGAMELREEEGGQWAWLAPYLQALAPAMRYRPATLNGVPYTIWMPQPFELEF
jgi:hypothetical protein